MQIQAVVDHQGEPIEFIFDTTPIPIVTGFNPDGSLQTARQLADRTLQPAATCAHSRATWSSNLAVKCPDCGQPMFLPPHLLAYLPASTLTAMYILWEAAGWPEWHGLAWAADPAYWTVIPHPLFAHCGGLAVRQDRQATYNDACMWLDDLA